MNDESESKMKKMVFCYVLFIAVFIVYVPALPASWPMVDKIQQRMPQNIVVLFSFKDAWRTWQSDPGRVKYVIVGECTAQSFPGEVIRLAVAGNVGGIEQIERKIRLATFFNAENVAVFWGIGNAARHESEEAIEAAVGEVVQIVEDTYPTAEILVVSPYDVRAVAQLGPAYRKKDEFHLSNPVGYAELIKRVPKLEDFVIGDRRDLFVKTDP